MLFSYHLLYFCTALSLIIMLSSHYHHHKSKTFSQLTQCPFTGTLLLFEYSHVFIDSRAPASCLSTDSSFMRHRRVNSSRTLVNNNILKTPNLKYICTDKIPFIIKSIFSHFPTKFVIFYVQNKDQHSCYVKK